MGYVDYMGSRVMQMYRMDEFFEVMSRDTNYLFLCIFYILLAIDLSEFYFHLSSMKLLMVNRKNSYLSLLSIK